jgi:hypothetical protein
MAGAPNVAATIRVLPPMRTNSTVDHDGGSACKDTFATFQAPAYRPTFLVVLTNAIHSNFGSLLDNISRAAVGNAP